MRSLSSGSIAKAVIILTVKEIYEKLLKAKRPIDFFGEVSDEGELKAEFRQYAKKVHPDIVPAEDSYIAGEAFSILNKLYNLGLSELEQGIYAVIDPVQIYQHMAPLFEITIKGELYLYNSYLSRKRLNFT